MDGEMNGFANDIYASSYCEKSVYNIRVHLLDRTVVVWWEVVANLLRQHAENPKDLIPGICGKLAPAGTQNFQEGLFRMTQRSEVRETPRALVD
jgi:hypothetical protein